MSGEGRGGGSACLTTPLSRRRSLVFDVINFPEYGRKTRDGERGKIGFGHPSPIKPRKRGGKGKVGDCVSDQRKGKILWGGEKERRKMHHSASQKKNEKELVVVVGGSFVPHDDDDKKEEKVLFDALIEHPKIPGRGTNEQKNSVKRHAFF